MSIRDEHYVDLRGKRHILYPGLLSLAHERGIRSIDEEILQIPGDANGHLAIVRATVKTEDERTFQGIGDSSPESVGKNIRPHLLRMASTRAKARAFRDFVNVADALVDDPGEEGAPVPETSPNVPPPGGTYLGVVQEEAAEDSFAQASPATVERLRTMVQKVRGPGGVSAMEDYLGQHLEDLTAEEALGWIEKLADKVE